MHYPQTVLFIRLYEGFLVRSNSEFMFLTAQTLAHIPPNILRIKHARHRTKPPDILS
jgi:hypothetical protein